MAPLERYTFVVAVLNNRDLNMVTWELRGPGRSPKLPQTQDVPDFDYARFAEMLGFVGRCIDGPDDVAPCLGALSQVAPSSVDDRRPERFAMYVQALERFYEQRLRRPGQDRLAEEPPGSHAAASVDAVRSFVTMQSGMDQRMSAYLCMQRPNGHGALLYN